MREEQVLGKWFRNVSCLVTKLEQTDSTSDCESSQLPTETMLISKFSAYLLSVIRTPFGPPISEDYLGGRSLVMD